MRDWEAVVTNHSIGTCLFWVICTLPFETSGTASCGSMLYKHCGLVSFKEPQGFKERVTRKVCSNFLLDLPGYCSLLLQRKLLPLPLYPWSSGPGDPWSVKLTSVSSRMCWQSAWEFPGVPCFCVQFGKGRRPCCVQMPVCYKLFWLAKFSEFRMTKTVCCTLQTVWLA